MNKKNSLLLSIIIVLILGLIITSGTFAYFQWSSGYAAGTGVNVTIEHGGITMHIESEQTEFVGLYPTDDCNNKYAYGDTLVTIVNNTGTLALPSFKLKVRVLKNGTQVLTSNDLKHIHYSVVPIETTKNIFGAPVKGEVIGGYTCSNVPSVNDNVHSGMLLTNGDGEVASSFDFKNVDVNGGWTHLPKVNDISSTGTDTTVGYLPRQYYISGDKLGEVEGITFKAGTYQTTYQFYRVYVWVDEGYTTTIVGDTVSDPLQNAKIEIMWSENSMVQQVSGESSEQSIAPGIYDESGNYTTWQELVDNGDITVVDNVITDSNRELTGELVIPEGITEIGDTAFGSIDRNNSSKINKVYISASVERIEYAAFAMCTSLTFVDFATGSKLTSIASAAFLETSLTSVEIPVSVENIESSSFEGIYGLETITFKGTVSQWNAITKGVNWNYFVPAVWVECFDGVVTLREAGLYDSYMSLTKSWQELLDDGDIIVVDNVITDSNRELTGTLIIPEGITEIGDYAFGHNHSDKASSKISDIYISFSVISIGNGAFNNYDVGNNNGTPNLRKVVFAPNSQLTNIGAAAFQYTGLTSIKIPANVKTIGMRAFVFIDSLNEIIFEGTMAEWNAIEHNLDWGYSVDKIKCLDGEVPWEYGN